MALHNLGFEAALHLLEQARDCANPNAGFREQLQRFESVRQQLCGRLLYYGAEGE